MKLKMTSLVLSALLPLSVLAAPATEVNQAATAQERNAEWRQENMQKRQAAWFDSLELSTEQRELFQNEMQQHREQQQKARAAHHEKLRSLLTDEQRVKFDQKTQQMQQRKQKQMQKQMQKNDKSKRAGQYKDSPRNNAVKE